MKVQHIISAIALTANFVSAQNAADPQPADSTKSPAVASVSPAALDTIPATTESLEAAAAPVPAVTDSALAVADSVPAVSETAPAVVDSSAVQAPVVTDSTPAVTDSAPAVADTVPAVSETAPAVTDSSAGQPPAATDSIPAVTKEAEPAEEVITLLAGTEISGAIHGFLKAANAPYLVTADLQIEKDAALIVEPGVVLQFTPGTGFYVKGQLVIAGEQASVVQLKSASSKPTNGDWKGLFISGKDISEIRHTTISGAANGLVVENSQLNLNFSAIENSTGRGLFVKNSKVQVSDSRFANNAGAALHIAGYGEVEADRLEFTGNNVALYSANLGYAEIGASSFRQNNIGILDLGNNHLVLSNTSINNNKIGSAATDVLDRSVLESIQNNESNLTTDTKSAMAALAADPEIPGVESRAIDPNENIAALIDSRLQAESQADSLPKSWNIMGNILIGDNFHYVKTRKNHSDRDVIIGNDTIAPGSHYRNQFQVPYFGTEFSVYMLMQSPDGKTIEFNTDITSDRWNKFSPNPVTLSYTDQFNNLVLGDFQKAEGDIYMSGLPLFGAGYTLSLLKNNANRPIFELGGFFGEVRRPYTMDSKHPLIYNEYIDDGELQAQRLAYGASFKWAPLRRFDATFGFIYANDEMEDPLLRDGSAKGSTNEPMQTSLTVYADGNWLFYPGDIELKGMIAVGRADTADVAKEHAINKVFSNAGLDVSSYSQIRQLMSHESRISSLSSKDLDAIFGDNTTLTREQKIDSLRTLIKAAKQAKKDADSNLDDSRVMGLNWGSQNFAIGASLFWNIYKTTLSGHIKYVGEDFYSAGSADQLSDTREFGGRLEQIITSFWTLGFGYDLNIENAANGSKTNLLGLGEGTRWGLFNDTDSKWFDEHELDNDRAKYIQNFALDNKFDINSKVTVNIGYNLEYRTQYRPYQLHGDYILEDGIYKDSWFEASDKRATTTIVDNDVETVVDSARWTMYMNMANEKYLASKFQERIYRNTWKADVSVEAFKSTFKVGGIWSLRTDNSKFFKDSLIEDFDLADTTWSKLGYYYGGADYFEQTYPISVSTSLDRIQNHFEVTPRFKSYKRDDLTESEITVRDEFEMKFLGSFLTLGLSGEIRHMTTSWEEGDNDKDESETDLLGNINVKLNHTKHLGTEWYTGTAMFYRPDNLSDEYKDFYVGVNVNYVF